MKRWFLGFLVVLLLVSPLHALEVPKKEILTYRISWNKLIGIAKASIVMKRNQEVLTIEMKAKTVEPVDTFFSVRDYFFSSTIPDISSFLKYEKRIKEGHYHRHDEILYNPSTGKLVYYKNGKLKKEKTIPPPLYDPCSILYAFRFRCPPDKGTCTLPSTDGKRVEKIQVVSLAEEDVTVPAGSFHTFKVEPRWRKMNGVFRKKKGGHVYVWFTRDQRRIPVKVEVDIFLGKVVGELTGYEIEQAEAKDSTKSR